MRRGAFAAIALALVTVACNSGGTPSPDPSGSPTKRPASTAKITILEPTPGSRVSLERPIFRVQLEGATLLKEQSADLRPDTGHMHITLDGDTISLLAGLEANLNDLLAAAEPPKPPLTAGQHLLEVEFAAADHGFFDPRVVVTTTFVAE